MRRAGTVVAVGMTVTVAVAVTGALTAGMSASAATTQSGMWIASGTPAAGSLRAGTVIPDSATVDGAQNGVTKGSVSSTGSSLSFAGAGLVSIPGSGQWNPGLSAVRMTAQVRFSKVPSAAVVDYDILRGPSQGAYKIEIVARNNRTVAVALCFFKGDRGRATLTSASSRNLADNAWHTIDCSKSATAAGGAAAVTLQVDGASATRTATLGTLSNSTGLSLAAKDYGSGGDWYTGEMRSVGITIG